MPSAYRLPLGFSRRHALLTLLLIGILLEDGFIRPFVGDVLVVMLGGGDKSTQQADIQAAITLSKTLED